MKANQQPKIGMWIRRSYYGLHIGKIVYIGRDGSCAVDWNVKFLRDNNRGWMGIHDGLAIHRSTVIRKCSIVSRKDAQAEIVMHQLAR